MSFDLFLERMKAGESAPADRSKVIAILRQHCQHSADGFGFYNVEFNDGSHVEFSAKHLESDGPFTGCAFHLRGFTPSVIAFVFAVAVAGDMVIFNAQARGAPDNPLAILVNERQLAELPAEVKANSMPCTSPEQLAQLICASFGQWVEFRDYAIGKQSHS